MNDIRLPKEGIFVGSGVYPTDTNTLLSTMIGHYSWQCQYFSPFDMIDRIVEDNQGNLAQVWGYARGFSPRLLAEWLYALDEVGVDIPAPDWDNFKNLLQSEYQDVFDKYSDRFGAGIARFIREAKKRGIYTALIYTSAETPWVHKMAEEGGEYYLGYDFGERYNIGLNEAKKILEESGELKLSALARSLESRVRAHVDERRAQGWGHIMATSANFTLDYEVLGGADIPVVEDFAFPNLNFTSGYSRGLYRQHNLPLWGSHLAHEHYAWLPNSDSHRWDLLRAGLYLKYMAGSKMIINESGNWFVEHTLSPDSPKLEVPQTGREKLGVIGWGAAKKAIAEEPETVKALLEEARPYFPNLDYNSEICRKYREIISDFWDYVKANGTPEGQPESVIALAKGNCDLASSRYNHNYAISGLYDIACKNPVWFEGAPERGWKLARDVFFPTVPVTKPYVNIHVSGTPYGQVDVVSFADNKIDADFLLRQYKALLFTGWNTCSEEQYEILRAYVEGGGTLFISIPQLSTNETRSLDVDVSELVHGGDFSDLAGVRVRGRGECIYWATVPPKSEALGVTFPRRFGILGVPLGDVEITDPELEILAIDDEQARPVVTRHRLGRGSCILLNTWTYPGALDMDEGPGGVYGSSGLLGYIYRAVANESRGHVYITDDKRVPGTECDYVSYSYFPEAGKICLFNVDFEQPHTVWLHRFGIHEKLTLAPGEFRTLETAKLE
ncbi:MAG: hypothetical protein SOX31_06355 [Eubacteriales bacterium]|nr:hypothetical protein [Eubacteriales bacterium]